MVIKLSLGFNDLMSGTVDETGGLLDGWRGGASWHDTIGRDLKCEDGVFIATV